MVDVFQAMQSAQETAAPARARVLALEGARNFRDIGGYPAAGGRRTRWHRVYRSGQLNKLTPADVRMLAARRILAIVDLREKEEIAHAPDILPPGATVIRCATGVINPLENWSHMLDSATSGVPFMRSIYSDIRGLGPRLKPFFQALLDLPEDRALLLHCMAGKDRTGMAIALLLLALGVPRDAILEDYLLTNQHGMTALDKTAKHLKPVPPNVECDLLASKEQYLEAFFAALEEHHGSAEQFLTQALGLAPDKIALLREKFTE